MTYEELQGAVEIFGLIGLENKDQIKKKYLLLSKKYHPDTKDGSDKKFQELTKAYQILNQYINSFKFRFTKEEFSNQYPLNSLDMKEYI